MLAVESVRIALQYVSDAMYASLGVLALVQWRRAAASLESAGVAFRWLACTFLTLAVVSIAGLALPQHHLPKSRLLDLSINVLLALLVLFPYFMYRFSTVFNEPSRVVRTISAAFTSIMTTWTLLLPPLPSNTNAPRNTTFEVWIIGFIIHWTVLSTIVAVRLWRWGRRQPSVVRGRMRQLAVGSVLLTVSLLISGSVNSGQPTWLLIVTSCLGIVAALTFMLGVSPPPVLRLIWRRRDLQDYRRTVSELMYSATREEISRAVLPHCVNVVGGTSAMLVQHSGEVVERFGIEASQASALAEQVARLEPAGGQGFVGHDVLYVSYQDGWVVLQVAPFTMLFGKDEVAQLRAVVAFMDLAFDRARLLASERATAVEKSELAERLAESNRELNRFAFVASHDLQEPLRMVMSYCQLLKRRYEGRLDDDADEFIGFAVDGAQRMQQLIEDLLTYSRVGSKGKPLQRTPCAEVLEQSLRGLRMAIEENDAEVTIGDLPTVMADASQLKQLFQNLLGNAIKFHGEHPPRIHVGAERRGSEWVVSVADNGIGIDAQYAEQVFEVFRRLHSRVDYPGTGIGLSICKSIMDRHGGRIWVEPRVGGGTTFSFTFPVVESGGGDEHARDGDVEREVAAT
jgi:signal transduction histidine kinase